MGRSGSRSQIARREHRVRAFDAYLRDARPVDVARSAIELPRGLQWPEVVGALCGLDDADGNTIALGLVEGLAHEVMRVLAPLLRSSRVGRVRIGRERKDGTSLASAPARRVSAPAGDGRDR
jgi:polynucleotide 5'-kinase involved in rRNA processing